MSMRDVVKVTAHLRHLERDFAAYDEAYRAFFAEPCPVRTTVGSGLMGILVEIDVVALLPGPALPG
ncbi:RidA family protein [Streptomyces diastaticus]